MIIETFEQGSPEWFAARLNVATASEFGRILTAGGKKSEQYAKYYKKLAMESITKKQIDCFKSDAMDRGNELESDARDLYAFLKDENPLQVGLIYKDKTKRVSCSPDSLIAKNLTLNDGWEQIKRKLKKGLEIKCPLDITHADYLIYGGLPAIYKPQVQGSMWVTGLEEWDFMSYHPDYKSLIVTVEKDPKYHELLDEIIPEFLREKKRYENKLREVL